MPPTPMNLSLVTSPSSTPRPSTRTRYFAPSIDLLRGHPSTTLLPTSEIYGAASIALHTPALLPSDSYAESRHPLHYGPDMGNLNVRVEIGRWVAKKYGYGTIPIEPERICLTGGASYALGAILASCTSPGTGYTRRAFMVSPTYFLATRVFEDAGFADKLRAITTTDKHTFDLDGLEAQLKALDATAPPVSLEDALRPILRAGVSASTKRIYKYVLYCVPTYSNPTGETWDLYTRQRLVALARKHDMLVISDDVYDFLGNVGDTSALGADGNLLPRLTTIEHALLTPSQRHSPAETGHCISNCSFSKLLGPGLRVGWIETPTPQIARQIGESGANHSGGAPCHFTSTLIHPLLLPHSPRQPHRKIDMLITRLSEAYTANCSAARSAVVRYLPEATEIWGGKGGFFIWLMLPEEIDAAEVCRLAAAKEGVVVASGGISECPGHEMGWGGRAVRISVSYCVEEEIEEGIRRLGLAIERWERGERCTVAGLPEAK